jgi:mitogen-activated protein kinase kinase kinase
MFGKQSLSSSPRNSPHLGYQSAGGRHEPISSRHGKSNSQESITPSTTIHRAGDGRGKEKALLVLGIMRDERSTNRQDYDGKSSGTGIVDRFRKKFRRDDDTNDDDSPTSPGWRIGGSNLPFTIPEGNASDSSLDRTSISSMEGVRSRGIILRSTPGGTAKNKSIFVFATKNGRVWVSVNVTNLEKGAGIRKEICRNLGINDYDAAAIHLTEVGQEPNGEQ